MRIIFCILLNFLSTILTSTDVAELNSCALVYLNGTLPTKKQDCWQDTSSEKKNCCWLNATMAQANSSISFCYPMKKGMVDIEIELLSNNVFDGLTVDYECSAKRFYIPFFLAAVVLFLI